MNDPLTALPNRVLFDDRLQMAISQARRYQRGFALMVVDLDRFSEVIAKLGRVAGDQLLFEMAKRLSSCVRESDTVARTGDDEFAIILGETASGVDVEQAARRAIDMLAEPCYLDAGTVRVTGSIGIALFPRHGDDADRLMRGAATALLEAKVGSSNGYRLHVSAACDDKTQRGLI